MKRISNKVEYIEVGRYHINEINERYNYDWFLTNNPSWAKVIYHTAYVICNVYTDQDTVMEAFLRVNGATATKQIALDASNKRYDFQTEQTILSQIVYNDIYNCHGYTFLDGQFWFELNKDSIQILLKDDRYIPCHKQDLKENGICVYYDQAGELIHTARKIGSSIISKFGINNILTYSEEEILTKYKNVDHSKTVYYNRRVN